jgi:ABC-type branched-subunit amino acid transport system substrate-binding protein
MNSIKLGFSTALTVAVAITSAAAAEVLVGVPLADNPDTSAYDKQIQVSSELASAELNAKGGVLGEQVRLIFANDECKPEPAVAAAETFVQQGVDFVAGHICSGAAIAASKVYEKAGVLMMAGSAVNPKLTDEGGPTSSGSAVAAIRKRRWRRPTSPSNGATSTSRSCTTVRPMVRA